MVILILLRRMSPVRYVYHKIKFDKCDSDKLRIETHANTFFHSIISINKYIAHQVVWSKIPFNQI